MSHKHARGLSRRIVAKLVRMYAPRGTDTQESIAITQFMLLTHELEAAIKQRAIGQRDVVIAHIALLLQQYAV